MKKSESRLVYSTDSGRIKPQEASPETPPASDGIVRLRLEKKGRKGKGVTTIEGLSPDPKILKDTCKRLKQLCSCGGAVKDYIIEIQGDQRQTIRTELEKQGFKVKLAGG